ncbi:hypothetical protein [Chondrinema litorale]|uniref:hypothetical protein n=1 Tax=Chondrinema litorale TaxID=2994555 RepID=UPI002543D4DF|nr:hypothetical protein [Chondrinema litorale]UZR95529.1 hypothetical protein OQ292_06845 [Chondrinema litorale]
MKQAYKPIHYIIIFLFILVSNNILAQEDTIDDPLHKPKVWEKITLDYQNIGLWEEYFDSKWDDLDIDIQQQIMKWQNILAIEMISREEAIYEVVEDNSVEWDIPDNSLTASVNTNYEDERIRVEALKYNQQIEEIIQQQSSELYSLKENVGENFAIIEDIFFEEFINYDKEYIYYSEAYPEKKYSKEKWVEDKTKELQNLKRSALGGIKIQAASNSSY